MSSLSGATSDSFVHRVCWYGSGFLRTCEGGQLRLPGCPSRSPFFLRRGLAGGPLLSSGAEGQSLSLVSFPAAVSGEGKLFLKKDGGDGGVRNLAQLPFSSFCCSAGGQGPFSRLDWMLPFSLFLLAREWSPSE